MNYKNDIVGKLAINGGAPVREKPFPPFPCFGEEEIQAAERVLRSGKFSRLSGEETAKFEEEYAKYFGVKHAIAVNNGTSCIHTALAAAGIGPGDEVIHSSHCFIGTATPSVHAGAVPVFADIDPRTYNVDPKSIEEKISERTKAIVPVHLNGCPAEMDEIMRIAKKHNLIVIEDSAQAHGALYNGRFVGTIGDVGCFSFWEDKIMTTGGEGGILITNNDEIARRARLIQNHGESAGDGEYYAGERLYYHEMLGYNYRMNELQAAIGREQLKKIDSFIQARRNNAHYLTELMSQVEGIITPYEPENVKHVFYKYIFRVDRNVLDVDAKEFVAALQKEGIPCSRRYPTPLHQQPVFVNKRGIGDKQFPFSDDVNYGSGLPNTELLPHELVRLCMSPFYEKEDLVDMYKAVSKVAAAYRK